LLAQVEPGELDVVLWPENSTDIDPRVDAEAGRLVGRAAAAVDAPILVGGQRYTGTHRYNEAILWAPGEGQVDVYAKQHPAPFAEYIPLRDIARMVTDAVDLVSIDMLPGDEVGVIALDSPRLGRVVELAVGICFEVAYADLIRDAVLAGGEVLVVPTNNASFGFTQESTQQLAMSVFRAVEHGRATVQISTVGVSGVISPNGVVTESSELFTADRFVAALPLRTSLTVADRLGVWPTVVVGAFPAVTVVAGSGGGAGPSRPGGGVASVGRRPHRAEEVVVRTLVIIPTCNERAPLPVALERTRAAVADADILVADDNSPDGTGAVAEGAAARDERIHVLHRPGKQGLGRAY